jgi:ATP-dependent Clp protease ATP-binding subunit ClpA
MFERFSKPAREVVVNAREQARELGHRFVGTEHLLLGLLAVDVDGPAGRALAAAGVEPAAVRAEVVRLVGTGPLPLGDADAAALRAIGIDLDAVRAKVEETFGPGALDEPPDDLAEPGGTAPSLLDRLRGRRPTPTPTDADREPAPGRHPRFVRRAKKVLELALREAIRLRHNHIGPEHLLLGILREGEGLAVRIMVDAGVDLGELRRRVQEGSDRAA